jgi:hypothetical protein
LADFSLASFLFPSGGSARTALLTKPECARISLR